MWQNTANAVAGSLQVSSRVAPMKFMPWQYPTYAQHTTVPERSTQLLGGQGAIRRGGKGLCIRSRDLDPHVVASVRQRDKQYTEEAEYKATKTKTNRHSLEDLTGLTGLEGLEGLEDLEGLAGLEGSTSGALRA